MFVPILPQSQPVIATVTIGSLRASFVLEISILGLREPICDSGKYDGCSAGQSGSPNLERINVSASDRSGVLENGFTQRFCTKDGLGSETGRQ